MRLLAELALVAALSAATLTLAAAHASAPRPAPAIPRITARTPLYLVERHFGSAQAQTVRPGGVGTFLYASRRHDWTIVLQIRPVPRPGDQP